MNEKPSCQPGKAARPRYVQALPTTRRRRPDPSPDASSRPQITIFLSWLAASNMGNDDHHPLR